MFKVRHKMPELSRAIDRLDMVLRNNTSSAIADIDMRLRFIIANALNECRDIADQSIDKMDERLKNDIELIQYAVYAIEERFYDKASEFIIGAIHASQTFIKSTPLLQAIEPACIVKDSSDGNVVFTLRGYFPGAGIRELQPTLVLNGVQATPSSPLNGRYSFSIPRNVLLSKDPDACVANIEIPVKNSKPHKYKLLIGIIPSSPGTIAVEHTNDIARREINPTLRSGHFHYTSSHASNQKHDTNNLCRVQVSPGWKVLQGSHRVEIHHNKGATSLQLEIETETEVAYRAMTYYRKSRRACGELRFTLSFIEYRELDIDPMKTTVELQWNESKLLNYPPGTWKVIFTPFDSKFAREFLAPHIDDPFINILSEGQGLRISTKDPTQIKRLQVTAAIPDNFTQEEEPESYLKKALIPAVTHTAAFAAGFGASRIAKL